MNGAHTQSRSKGGEGEEDKNKGNEDKKEEEEDKKEEEEGLNLFVASGV